MLIVTSYIIRCREWHDRAATRWLIASTIWTRAAGPKGLDGRKGVARSGEGYGEHCHRPQVVRAKRAPPAPWWVCHPSKGGTNLPECREHWLTGSMQNVRRTLAHSPHWFAPPSRTICRVGLRGGSNAESYPADRTGTSSTSTVDTLIADGGSHRPCIERCQGVGA